jgi:hypothetical protein
MKNYPCLNMKNGMPQVVDEVLNQVDLELCAEGAAPTSIMQMLFINRNNEIVKR